MFNETSLKNSCKLIACIFTSTDCLYLSASVLVHVSILTHLPFKTPWHLILFEFIFVNTQLEFIDLPSFSFLCYWHASQIWLSLSVFGSNFPILCQAELLSLAHRHFQGLTVWRTGKPKHEKTLKSRCNTKDDSRSWSRYNLGYGKPKMRKYFKSKLYFFLEVQDGPCLASCILPGSRQPCLKNCLL